MPVFPMAVTGRTTLTSGWKVELGIGDPEAIADVGVYDTSRYPDLTSESFFTFPGTAGSYLSTPDTNLLDADTAHLQQSSGAWANNNNATLNLLSDVPIFGSYSLRVKRGGTASNAQAFSGSGTSGAAVSPSTTYTASFAAVEGTAGKYAQARLYWWDSGGAYLSASGWSSAVLLTASEQTVSITAVSHASAAYASVGVMFSGDGAGSDPGTGAFMYLGKAVVAEGTDPEFIPSLRIVGDIDMEAKVTSTWAPPLHQYARILSTRNTGAGGFNLVARGDLSAIRLEWDEGTGSVPGYDSTGFPAADVPVTIRFTGGPYANAWAYTFDGVNAGSVSVAMNPLGTIINDLCVGIDSQYLDYPFIGDIYSAEVRDGIDGPVVARFDAADYLDPAGPIPDGTIWKGPTGRTWTAHGTLESVKREPDTKPIYGSNDPFGYLVDVTSRVEGLSTTRGRERFTSRFRTGTASISVLNTDGAFTPPSGGGPIGILPLRPGRAVKITNNGADVFAGFIDSFTGYQEYDGKVSTTILCVDQFGQFTRNDLPAVTAEGAGDTVVARMRRLLDRHIGDKYTFAMMGTPKATFQATEMARDLMSESALTADSEGGGVWVGKDGSIVASGRDYFSDIAAAGVVEWSVGGTNPITIQGYTDEWAAIRILNEAHFSRAGGTEQIRTNDESISKFGRRTHTRLDLINDNDTYVGELAERLVQFAGVDRLRITGLTFLPEVDSAAADMAVRADFGDLILVTITTIFGVEWTAPVQVFGVQHTVSDEVWETVLLTDDTLFTGEFYSFQRDSFDNDAFS